MARIIVVGAGIAGLAAGWDLQRAGHDVTVLDRSDLAGGRMADRIAGPLCVHTGASIVFSFSRDLVALAEEAGVAGERIDLATTRSYTVDDGSRTYPLRLTFDPGFLLAHPALGVLTKARLAKLLPDMAAAALRTDPCLMHTAAHLDDETVAAYVTRKVSAEFLETYVEPYFRAPWHWEPEDISRAYLVSLMGHVMTGGMFSFRTGIGRLTRALARALDVTLGAEVTNIAEHDDGCTLEYRLGDGEHVLKADAVVCAVQGNLVRRLVPDLPAAKQAFFGQVRYTRGARLYYALSRCRSEPRLVWFSRSHPGPLSLFHVAPQDTLVPDGHVQPAYVQVELAPAVSRRIAAEGGQGRLDSYARDAARTHYPTLDDDVTHVVEQWWDEMLPEWYPGYAKCLSGFLAAEAGDRSRIAYCGDYLSQSHTGGACASGRLAARAVERRLAA